MYMVDRFSVVEGEARSTRVSGLIPGTQYYISVKCYNVTARYCGDFDQEIAATTYKGK